MGICLKSGPQIRYEMEGAGQASSRPALEEHEDAGSEGPTDVAGRIMNPPFCMLV